MKFKLLGFFLSVFLCSIFLGCKKQKRYNESLNGLKTERVDSDSPFDFCSCYLPIGGGDGYQNIVTSGTPGKVVFTHVLGVPQSPIQQGDKLELLVSTAVSGDVIFLENDVEARVSHSLVIPSGVTIASDRGFNGSDGAIIKFDTGVTGVLLDVNGSNVRITGVRLEGGGVLSPNNTIALEMQPASKPTGLVYVYLEVDNCEIYEWSEGLRLSQYFQDFGTISYPIGQHMMHEDGFLIHNNYIHDNNWNTGGSLTGYGVVVYDAFVKIYANNFLENRQDVAGTGRPKSGYEVFCNNMGKTWTNVEGYATQNIDMHGDFHGSRFVAGGFMHIHHNNFAFAPYSANIVIGGKPSVLCLIDNNMFVANKVFAHTSYNDQAIDQTRNTSEILCNDPALYGHIIAANNIYNNNYKGWYVRNDWNHDNTARLDNLIRIPSSNDILMSNLNVNEHNAAGLEGGVDNCNGLGVNLSYQILDYYFGDFNGDGVTDIFKKDAGIAYYLPINSTYTDQWITIGPFEDHLGTMTCQNSNAELYKFNPNVNFGNYNTDGSTDIFKTTGTVWLVYYGGSSSWITYVNSNNTMNQLLFGKFFKTGTNLYITDTFYPQSPTWRISYDGTSYVIVPGSFPGILVSKMRVGDFNGDFRSDIFYTTGSQWHYRNLITNTWSPLAFSNTSSDFLLIGDFNTDNVSDVFGFVVSSWKVSIGGSTNYQLINTGNFPRGSFQYGDLN